LAGALPFAAALLFAGGWLWVEACALPFVVAGALPFAERDGGTAAWLVAMGCLPIARGLGVDPLGAAVVGGGGGWKAGLEVGCWG